MRTFLGDVTIGSGPFTQFWSCSVLNHLQKKLTSSLDPIGWDRPSHPSPAVQ